MCRLTKGHHRDNHLCGELLGSECHRDPQRSSSCSVVSNPLDWVPGYSFRHLVSSAFLANCPFIHLCSKSRTSELQLICHDTLEAAKHIFAAERFPEHLSTLSWQS